jgi:hypothetical protein
MGGALYSTFMHGKSVMLLLWRFLATGRFRYWLLLGIAAGFRSLPRLALWGWAFPRPFEKTLWNYVSRQRYKAKDHECSQEHP